jgi:hypothetical protein
MSVADEIYRQMGGYRFATMTGAKHFASGEDKLQFSLPKCKDGINKVVITLTPEDLYTLEFYRLKWRSVEYNLVSEIQCVFADQLQEVFTEYTGLYTSL